MTQSKEMCVTHKNSGFTWLEALVAFSILAVLVGIVWPVVITRCRASPKTIDMSNLRQISVAMIVYSTENEDLLPVHPRDAVDYTGLDTAGMRNVYLSPYQDGNEAIDRGDGDGIAVRYGGYVFVNLGLNLEEIEEPAEFILAYTAKITPEQATRNVAFADGHVESWEEEQLRASLPESVDVDALDGP